MSGHDAESLTPRFDFPPETLREASPENIPQTGSGTSSDPGQSVLDRAQVAGEPSAVPRSFRQISMDTQAAQERLLDLFRDDESLVEQANDILNELDLLRREAIRLVRKQVEAKVDMDVRDRAEREVMARFAHGRPNAHVLKAEANLKKVAQTQNMKPTRQREFDEALWQLNVAHGYATARAIESDGTVPAFRAQVVAALEVWAAKAEDNPARAAAFKFAVQRVAKMVAVLPDADLGQGQ